MDCSGYYGIITVLTWIKPRRLLFRQARGVTKVEPAPLAFFLHGASLVACWSKQSLMF
jgi:hypothetical protein